MIINSIQLYKVKNKFVTEIVFNEYQIHGESISNSIFLRLNTKSSTPPMTTTATGTLIIQQCKI